MNRLAGKAAIVTGSGSGIGRAIADALALIRPEQKEKAGWAKRFREAMAAKKAAK